MDLTEGNISIYCDDLFCLFYNMNSVVFGNNILTIYFC